MNGVKTEPKPKVAGATAIVEPLNASLDVRMILC